MSEIREKQNKNRSVDKKTCNFCGVVKRTPADLKRHVRMHTGERPFNCSHCGKAFKAKRTAQIHKYIHHGIASAGTNISTKYKTERLQFLKRQREINLIGNWPDDEVNMEVEDVKTEDEDNSPKLPESTSVTDDPGPPRRAKTISPIRECVRPERLHRGTRPFHCSICECHFKAYSTLKYHMRRDHDMPVILSKSWEERFQRLQCSKRESRKSKPECCLTGNERYMPIVIRHSSLGEYKQFRDEKISKTANINISFMGKMMDSGGDQGLEEMTLTTKRSLITEYSFDGPSGPQPAFSCEICRTLFSSFAMCTLHLTEHCKDSTFSNEVSSLSDMIIRVGTCFKNL